MDSNPNSKLSENNQPIDVVVAWVDGDDPKLAEKRNNFIKKNNLTNIAGATPAHFASNNEIRYCVLSILKFAPFVRNIYIVTDEQDPNIWDDVKAHFPHRLESIKIVDHKEIFRGYEDCLPTFNSIAIGNMTWRIDGLSDNYVYFNDDVFLIRDISPSDWVLNGRPVLRGHWMFPPYLKIVKNKVRRLVNNHLLGKRSYKPKFSFYLVQWNAAKLLGFRFRFLFNCHTPHVINRKMVENFYSKHPHLLKQNIAYRFREQFQFNVTTLANHIEVANGNRQISSLNLGYLHPFYSKNEIKRRIKQCQADSRIKSICVQNLEKFSDEQQKDIFTLMDNVMKLSNINQSNNTY
jgi:hypothetical protein